MCLGGIDLVFGAARQDLILLVLGQVGVGNQKPNLSRAESFVASLIVKAEVPGMNDGVGLCLSGQCIDDPKLAMGIADQQASPSTT